MKQKIKIIFRDLLRILKELLILIIIGIFLFPLLSIIGFFYTVFKHLIKRDYSISKQTIPIIHSFTLASDGFANASAGELLNDIFKIKGQIKYGKWYQTISAVTGLLYIFEHKNSKLRNVLNKIEKNHCEEAITEQDMFFWFNQIRKK